MQSEPKSYARQEMIEILRRINSQLDRPVQVSDVDEWFRLGKGPSHRAIEREFGGMAKARRAAGINNSYQKDSIATRYWQKYTPEELIGQLQKLSEKLGKNPTVRDINQACKEGLCASSTTFARMFGSLPKAYRKAGFARVRPRSYTDQEILSALKQIAKEKGGMTTYYELAAASKAGRCPIEEIAKSGGAAVIWLPPYSPDFSPIKQMWSKLKTYLRKAKARTMADLDRAVAEGLKLITEGDCCRWFQTLQLSSHMILKIAISITPRICHSAIMTNA